MQVISLTHTVYSGERAAQGSSQGDRHSLDPPESRVTCFYVSVVSTVDLFTNSDCAYQPALPICLTCSQTTVEAIFRTFRRLTGTNDLLDLLAVEAVNFISLHTFTGGCVAVLQK